eukprot:evm.model.scf_365.7 EVM.evm.TU.scf_365.7   scf_365:27090-31625(+)
MKVIVKNLEESSVLLEAVLQENIALRAGNDRLAAIVREQQTLISVLSARRQVLTPPPSTSTAGDVRDQPAAIPWSLPVPDAALLSTANNVTAHASDDASASSPMFDETTLVRLLRSVLKEHRISAGDDQAPCTALALLATLVAAAAEFGARRLASRPARPSDLVSGPSHDEPWHGEVKEWARRLGRLRLGEAQREAILEMRAAQMARLRVVCEERCRLNEKVGWGGSAEASPWIPAWSFGDSRWGRSCTKSSVKIT